MCIHIPVCMHIAILVCIATNRTTTCLGDRKRGDEKRGDRKIKLACVCLLCISVYLSYPPFSHRPFSDLPTKALLKRLFFLTKPLLSGIGASKVLPIVDPMGSFFFFRDAGITPHL